jgi:hypothetical protein
LLVEDDRIASFYCDQGSPESVKDLWSNRYFDEIELDLIVDDGRHWFGHNVTFLENSIHKLRQGGLFVVEDIRAMYLSEWRSYVARSSVSGRACRLHLIELPHAFNRKDNNILCVEVAE